MPEIKKQTTSPLAKTVLLNEAIDVINALGFNMTVRAGVGTEMPQLKLADNNCELIVSAGTGAGGAGTVDVIWCVNGVPFNGTVQGTIGDAI